MINLNSIDHVFNDEALMLVKALEKFFGPKRKKLLEDRKKLANLLAQGATSALWQGDETATQKSWHVNTIPEDLYDRRVEITGPASDRKMMINAMNSGANCYLADLEDSVSPTWENIRTAHNNLYDATKRSLSYKDPKTAKTYQLDDKIKSPTLLVRPRGWHLEEKNVTLDGAPISASLFDFGIYFYHHVTAKRNAARYAPYFYLPKIEHANEAELWADVFSYAESYMDIPQGTIRATVLIETFPAAFQMESILYVLKDYICALNAGRWDYLFSMIKLLGADPVRLFPDRSQLSMTQPFMQTYCELLVQTCHKRGALAIGGMSAFLPSKDVEVNNKAFEQVKADKEREAAIGFDGTWVAHPDLVAIARNVFLDKNQITKKIDKEISLGSLLPAVLCEVTEEGVKENFNVCLTYIENWLAGKGAVAINNLMEDAATAEISRVQLWQWYQRDITLTNDKKFRDVLKKELLPETEYLLSARGPAGKLVHDFIYPEICPDFLTTTLYKELNG